MEIKFINGRAYFPYNQLEKEIDLHGSKTFFNKEDIENSVKGKEGYYVTGRVDKILAENMFHSGKNPYIYAVSTNCNKPMFCTINGNVVYY